MRARGITGDTFILGMGMNGGNLWAEMLELLQIMVALGMVDTKTENGAVVYSLGANAKVTGVPELSERPGGLPGYAAEAHK
jgi:hypothetical protein